MGVDGERQEVRSKNQEERKKLVMPNLFWHPISKVYNKLVTYPVRCRNKFGMTSIPSPREGCGWLVRKSREGFMRYIGIKGLSW
ncbi:hypothetical protein SAMN05428975_1577 [Mucilaginibacter sp. OK268]|nr:hypothetical protein SAMN05428975_1577 [Mucilaginibacter sp. OK268]